MTSLKLQGGQKAIIYAKLFKFPSSSADFAPAHNPQSIVIDPKTEALFDHTELFLGERVLTKAIKNSWVFLEYRGNQPMVLAFVAPNNSEESKSLLLRLSVYLSRQNFEIKPIDTDERWTPKDNCRFKSI